MPEPYLLLKELSRAPYGLNYENPQRTADLFAGDVSSIILENDGIITTGKNLTQAFDRLEVAEYSAKALIDARVLGEMVKINEDQTRQIERIFKLD